MAEKKKIRKSTAAAQGGEISVPAAMDAAPPSAIAPASAPFEAPLTQHVEGDTTQFIRREIETEAIISPDTAPFGAPSVKHVESDTTQFIRRESDRPDGDTSFRLYLQEIGRVKLLTAQEEIDLAARIKKGDAKAREHMIKANLRLVVKIARDYEGIGLPLLDLISEGNIGLMKAVERFDPAKGGKLSTYGSWWIKQAMKRALANQSKTIRLPVHLVDKLSKMRRVAVRLQEELGHEPSDEEVAAEMGMTASRVAQMRTAAMRPASLDAPMGEDGSSNFSDLVEDEHASNPYAELEDKTVVNMLQGMVKHLNEREAAILSYRFGLDGGQERTLEEVGEKFNVTRERVRQIQNLALSKLRKMIEKVEHSETKTD